MTRVAAALAILLVPAMLLPSPAEANQTVVIVLDNSGSMAQRMRRVRRTRRIDAAKVALKSVLEQLPDDSQVGLVALNSRQDRWLIPLGPLDQRNLDNMLKRIQASGGTPLGQVMKIGADALLEARADQVYGTYKLLIVTDGEASDPQLVERFLPDILSRGLVVDVIGVDMQRNHSLATRVQTYRRADDPDSLRQAISEIVLGESTADSGDAAESDFEVLAGLSDELAIAALDALRSMGNHPIGQQAPAVVAPGEVAQTQPQDTTAPGQAPSQPTTYPAQPSSGGSGGSVLMTVLGLFCAGGMAVIILFVVGIFLLARK